MYKFNIGDIVLINCEYKDWNNVIGRINKIYTFWSFDVPYSVTNINGGLIGVFRENELTKVDKKLAKLLYF